MTTLMCSMHRTILSAQASQFGFVCFFSFRAPSSACTHIYYLDTEVCASISVKLLFWCPPALLQGLELLVQNLSRLDESNEEDAKGVNTTMGVLENLLEVHRCLCVCACVLRCHCPMLFVVSTRQYLPVLHVIKRAP